MANVFITQIASSWGEIERAHVTDFLTGVWPGNSRLVDANYISGRHWNCNYDQVLNLVCYYRLLAGVTPFQACGFLFNSSVVSTSMIISGRCSVILYAPVNTIALPRKIFSRSPMIWLRCLQADWYTSPWIAMYLVPWTSVSFHECCTLCHPCSNSTILFCLCNCHLMHPKQQSFWPRVLVGSMQK